MYVRQAKPTFAFGLLAVSLSFFRAPAAQGAAADEIEDCLTCHGNDSLSVTLESGEEAPLFMKRELLPFHNVGKNLPVMDQDLWTTLNEVL